MDYIQAALGKARLQLGIERPEASPVAPFPVQGGEDQTWAALPQFEIDPRRLDANGIITSLRRHEACSQFDILRTTVRQKLRQKSWTTVAVTSPTAGCGKTSVALNLAMSLANQKDCRTVLLDLDLRRPRVGKVLGLQPSGSLAKFLAGRAEISDVFVRCGENLAVGANEEPVSLSAELLQSADTARALSGLRQRLKPTIVLIDLPPMLSSDDVMAVLPIVDTVMLVVAAGSSKLQEVDLCERTLSEQAKLLGVVLNKCRYSPEHFGY